MWMSNFVLIDLVSQANAVAKYVQNWSEKQILQWLAQRGTLTKREDRFGPIYCFESTLGFWVHFFLDGDQFTFLAQHTTWRPKID